MVEVLFAAIGAILGVAGFALAVGKAVSGAIRRLEEKLDGAIERLHDKIDAMRENELKHLEGKVVETCVAVGELRARISMLDCQRGKGCEE